MADFWEIFRNIVLNSSSVNAVETMLRGGGFFHRRRVPEGVNVQNGIRTGTGRGEEKR
jgi:hypothetical protein